MECAKLSQSDGTADRSIEEIVYAMLARPNRQQITLAELRSAYTTGGELDRSLEVLFDEVVARSWEIRSAMMKIVEEALDRTGLTQAQKEEVISQMKADERPMEARPAEFEPSYVLCRAYDRALGGLARFVGRAARWADFWDVVRSVLIGEARFKREDRELVAPLADADGRFEPSIANRIVERLMVDPSGSDEFLAMLARELAVHIDAGGIVKGSWGRIEVSEGALVYRLTAKEKVVYEPATKKTTAIDL
jgi:hypothetical protein